MRIERYEQDSLATHGRLFLPGGVVLETLEPPWRNNEPFRSCVPEAEYELVPHDGEKYRDTWALVGPTVSHFAMSRKRRSMCVLHAGNFPHETTGCVLVGLARNDRAVEGSAAAMDLVRDALKAETLVPDLIIVNATGLPVLAESEAPPSIEEPRKRWEPLMGGTKHWFQSRTLWFNILAGILGALVNSATNADIDPTVQLGIVTAGNFFLRLVTTDSIS